MNNECDAGLHTIVRREHGKIEATFGKCDSCHVEVLLNDMYNQQGGTEIFRRQNFYKGLRLNYILGQMREQENFDVFTEDERQYIQILNTTINDIEFFKYHLGLYEEVRKK